MSDSGSLPTGRRRSLRVEQELSHSVLLAFHEIGFATLKNFKATMKNFLDSFS
jgi:hypothetical protein